MQLPVSEIFSQSLQTAFSSYKEILRLCWPYTLLIFVITIVSDSLEFSVFGSIASSIAATIVGIMALVRCHQIFLLPEVAVSQTKPLGWGSRETTFLLRSISLTILVSLIGFPIFFLTHNSILKEAIAVGDTPVIANIFGTFLLLPIYYVAARLSLALPDAAAGQKRPLFWAWQFSKGHSFNLFLLLAAIPLLAEFSISTAFYFFPDHILVNLIQTAIWLIISVIEICILSFSYAFLVSNT